MRRHQARYFTYYISIVNEREIVEENEVASNDVDLYLSKDPTNI